MPQRIFFAFVKRLQGRRGRTQHNNGAFARRLPARNGARVVTRLAVLLVGAFVFLVDDDGAHVRQRREQRAASTYYNARLARADKIPLVKALSLAHARMHNGNLVAEASAKTCDRLGRKRNLWHQNNGILPLFQNAFDNAQIHFRLA